MKSTFFYFIALCATLFISPVYGKDGTTEFFVIWGKSGSWKCTLTMENGEMEHVQPYLFLGEQDKIEKITANQVVCSSETPGSVDGLHILAKSKKNTSIKFTSNKIEKTITLDELPDEGYLIFRNSEQEFLIIGKGDPGVGPYNEIEKSLGKLFEPPIPQNAVSLPDNWNKNGRQVNIHLSQKIKGDLQVRRCSNNDGKLYLEVYIPGKELKGKAAIECNGTPMGNTEINNSLWLSLKPCIDTLSIQVTDPSGTKKLAIATTLVEVRKNKLYVNGEPFLIKGVLSGKLTQDEARYVKNLGINTIRGGTVTEEAERYGFMVTASIQGGGLKKISDYVQKGDLKELEENLKDFLENTVTKGTPAFNSPNTLAIQLDNERTEIGANTLNGEKGADPWSEYFYGKKSEFNILNGILVQEWNRMKPLAPMLPFGYANESLGYIAPGFLDVIMHNTFLEKDRYGVPLKTFVKWQGGEKRPFINTEFGANRYTPESYHGAGNSPVLEKLHAWNFKELWKVYMDAGTSGGTIYRLTDGDTTQAIQGVLNFGIMTLDKQPKLACWELMHIWRDFEVERISDHQLLFTYKRDYKAQNCELTLTGAGKTRSINLGEFLPNTKRVIDIPDNLNSFHWKVDYSTHQGLPMTASGAWPFEIEQQDFIAQLKKRDTYSFLSELFDAKVITIDEQKAPATFAELQRADGVIPVAFQKPDGTIYVTAFARISPKNGYEIKADIHTSFKGKVVAVDEWTGKALPGKVPYEQTSKGLTFTNVTIPVIPGPIGQRSDKPVVLPVFRITPFNDK